MYKTITLEEWDDLQKKFPITISRFRKWVDEYKKKVVWDILFNWPQNIPAGKGLKSPKLHDLPIAMQIGIFMQFISEIGLPKEDGSPGVSMDGNVIAMMDDSLKAIEDYLENS